MLTPKQKQLLLFIHGRIAEAGVPPSFDEMKEALDLKSKSGIHRLIMALEERGFIRRLPHRARALEIVKLPEGGRQPLQAARPRQGFSPTVIQGRRSGYAPDYEGVPAPSGTSEARPSGTGTGYGSTPGIPVPVMGRIAAGVPRSAIEDAMQTLMLPQEILSSGEHFALEVQGDSMIEAGIKEGDTVIFKRVPSADSGDIVVALVDDEEATLKRFRRKGQSIALEPANPHFETRIFGPDRVKIQGKLVALIRQF